MYRLNLCILFVFSILVAACGSTGNSGSGTGSGFVIGDAYCTKMEACNAFNDATEITECITEIARIVQLTPLLIFTQHPVFVTSHATA